MPPTIASEHCEFGPWTVVASKSHIMSSDGPECQRYGEKLKLPHLPEMVFPNNILKLEHVDGFGIEFNALDALSLVDPENDLMKVAVSSEWLAARANCEHINDKAKPFDWTYTTEYKGSIFGDLKVIPTEERIELEKLKQREKIHFYQDILLFEDELSDHGCSIFNVKIRVMPTSLFILQRQYVRVDNVIVRVYDTRVYHEASWNYILREHSQKEGKISSLKVPLSILTDRNEVGQHLELKYELFEKLCFPEKTDSTNKSTEASNDSSAS